MASEMLIGLKVIAARFATSKRNVKDWKKKGAPIAMFNRGSGVRYRADYKELYDWLCKEQA